MRASLGCIRGGKRRGYDRSGCTRIEGTMRREGTMRVIAPGTKRRQVAGGVYTRREEVIREADVREEKGQ